ncbi:unnamed protein product [Amoebophrya sp. A120]|nr:unnamed protein product [Amoebophrya sp. A120]|eukprot:GSA120T00002197001.1
MAGLLVWSKPASNSAYHGSATVVPSRMRCGRSLLVAVCLGVFVPAVVVRTAEVLAQASSSTQRSTATTRARRRLTRRDHHAPVFQSLRGTFLDKRRRKVNRFLRRAAVVDDKYNRIELLGASNDDDRIKSTSEAELAAAAAPGAPAGQGSSKTSAVLTTLPPFSMETKLAREAMIQDFLRKEFAPEATFKPEVVTRAEPGSYPINYCSALPLLAENTAASSAVDNAKNGSAVATPSAFGQQLCSCGGYVVSTTTSSLGNKENNGTAASHTMITLNLAQEWGGATEDHDVDLYSPSEEKTHSLVRLKNSIRPRNLGNPLTDSVQLQYCCASRYIVFAVKSSQGVPGVSPATRWSYIDVEDYRRREIDGEPRACTVCDKLQMRTASFSHTGYFRREPYLAIPEAAKANSNGRNDVALTAFRYALRADRALLEEMSKRFSETGNGNATTPTTPAAASQTVTNACLRQVRRGQWRLRAYKVATEDGLKDFVWDSPNVESGRDPLREGDNVVEPRRHLPLGWSAWKRTVVESGEQEDPLCELGPLPQEVITSINSTNQSQQFFSQESSGAFLQERDESNITAGGVPPGAEKNSSNATNETSATTFAPGLVKDTIGGSGENKTPTMHPGLAFDMTGTTTAPPGASEGTTTAPPEVTPAALPVEEQVIPDEKLEGLALTCLSSQHVELSPGRSDSCFQTAMGYAFPPAVLAEVPHVMLQRVPPVQCESWCYRLGRENCAAFQAMRIEPLRGTPVWACTLLKQKPEVQPTTLAVGPQVFEVLDSEASDQDKVQQADLLQRNPTALIGVRCRDPSIQKLDPQTGEKLGTITGLMPRGYAVSAAADAYSLKPVDGPVCSLKSVKEFRGPTRESCLELCTANHACRGIAFRQGVKSVASEAAPERLADSLCVLLHSDTEVLLDVEAAAQIQADGSFCLTIGPEMAALGGGVWLKGHREACGVKENSEVPMDISSAQAGIGGIARTSSALSGYLPTVGLPIGPMELTDANAPVLNRQWLHNEFAIRVRASRVVVDAVRGEPVNEDSDELVQVDPGAACANECRARSCSFYMLRALPGELRTDRSSFRFQESGRLRRQSSDEKTGSSSTADGTTGASGSSFLDVQRGREPQSPQLAELMEQLKSSTAASLGLGPEAAGESEAVLSTREMQKWREDYVYCSLWTDEADVKKYDVERVLGAISLRIWAPWLPDTSLCLNPAVTPIERRPPLLVESALARAPIRFGQRGQVLEEGVEEASMDPLLSLPVRRLSPLQRTGARPSPPPPSVGGRGILGKNATTVLSGQAGGASQKLSRQDEDNMRLNMQEEPKMLADLRREQQETPFQPGASALEVAARRRSSPSSQDLPRAVPPGQQKSLDMLADFREYRWYADSVLKNICSAEADATSPLANDWRSKLGIQVALPGPAVPEWERSLRVLDPKCNSWLEKDGASSDGRYAPSQCVVGLPVPKPGDAAQRPDFPPLIPETDSRGRAKEPGYVSCTPAKGYDAEDYRLWYPTVFPAEHVPREKQSTYNHDEGFVTKAVFPLIEQAIEYRPDDFPAFWHYHRVAEGFAGTKRPITWLFAQENDVNPARRLLVMHKRWQRPSGDGGLPWTPDPALGDPLEASLGKTRAELVQDLGAKLQTRELQEPVEVTDAMLPRQVQDGALWDLMVFAYPLGLSEDDFSPAAAEMSQSKYVDHMVHVYSMEGPVILNLTQELLVDPLPYDGGPAVGGWGSAYYAFSDDDWVRKEAYRSLVLEVLPLVYELPSLLRSVEDISSGVSTFRTTLMMQASRRPPLGAGRGGSSPSASATEDAAAAVAAPAAATSEQSVPVTRDDAFQTADEEDPEGALDLSLSVSREDAVLAGEARVPKNITSKTTTTSSVVVPEKIIVGGETLDAGEVYFAESTAEDLHSSTATPVFDSQDVQDQHPPSGPSAADAGSPRFSASIQHVVTTTSATTAAPPVDSRWFDETTEAYAVEYEKLQLYYLRLLEARNENIRRFAAAEGFRGGQLTPIRAQLVQVIDADRAMVQVPLAKNAQFDVMPAIKVIVPLSWLEDARKESSATLNVWMWLLVVPAITMISVSLGFIFLCPSVLQDSDLQHRHLQMAQQLEMRDRGGTTAAGVGGPVSVNRSIIVLRESSREGAGLDNSRAHESTRGGAGSRVQKGSKTSAERDSDARRTSLVRGPTGVEDLTARSAAVRTTTVQGRPSLRTEENNAGIVATSSGDLGKQLVNTETTAEPRAAKARASVFSDILNGRHDEQISDEEKARRRDKAKLDKYSAAKQRESDL